MQAVVQASKPWSLLTHLTAPEVRSSDMTASTLLFT
jgi:hypothetical protein